MNCYKYRVKLIFLPKINMDNNPNEMVTKKDIHNATASLVTKDEFKAELQSLRNEMFTKNDHAKFVKGLQIWQKFIEGEFVAIREYMTINMYTKQDHARDLVWMDKAMVEIEAAREERLLSGRQKQRIDDKLFDHEKRISALENG